jgi:ribose 5-phosphate isomerase A
LQLIKGGGGALTREKIIAGASKRFLCIVDESKQVATLGRFPLPVEVLAMAQAYLSREFRALGGRPLPRNGFITDDGNPIIDIHDLSIDDPLALEARISLIPGVVTVGLFAHRPADLLIVGSTSGAREIRAAD